MANVALPFLNSVQTHFNLNQPAAPAPQPARQGAGIGGIALPFVQPVPVFVGGFGGGNGGNIHMNAHGNLREIRDYQNEDRDENRASTAAIVGAVATIALAAVSAFALRSYCDDREELKVAIEFKKQLVENPALRGLGEQHRFDLNEVADKTIEIFEDKCSRSRNIVILGGAALATGIAGFVAGMLSIQWLITAAIVTGVALAAITVFMVIWNCTAKSDLTPEMAHKVEVLIQDLRNP